MVRALRKLVSLPVQWAGQIAAMFSAPAAAALLRVAWRIGRDGEIGRLAVSQLWKSAGPAVAYAVASRWMDLHPQPETASWAGLLAVDMGDLSAARDWLARGRACGDDTGGFGEVLELNIARQAGGAEWTEVVDRLSGRRDLLPLVRRSILEECAAQELARRDFDAARRQAKYLVGVEDNPRAEMILWAVARQAGDAPAASRHLARAGKGLPAAHWNYMRCLGALAIGDAEELREARAALADLDERLATAVSDLVAGQGQ